jgi:hypothetical protein
VGLGVYNHYVAVGIVPIKNVSLGADRVPIEFDLFVTIKVYLLDFQNGPWHLLSVVTV